MIVYLFIKEDNTIYGYHTKEVEGSIPFETNLDEKDWAEYFLSIQSAAKLIDNKIETFEVFDKKPLEIELMQIFQWLADNDYKINKHALGEYTDNDPKWTTYLAERKAKLLRYNELEEQLALEE
jgi:hypothetical protein